LSARDNEQRLLDSPYHVCGEPFSASDAARAMSTKKCRVSKNRAMQILGIMVSRGELDKVDAGWKKRISPKAKQKLAGRWRKRTDKWVTENTCYQPRYF